MNQSDVLIQKMGRLGWIILNRPEHEGTLEMASEIASKSAIVLKLIRKTAIPNRTWNISRPSRV